jgi:hypothetical protein
MARVFGKCVADRATRVSRDTGPSAAFSGIAAYTYTAATPTPCGLAKLTRSRSGALPNPIRVTVCPSRAMRDEKTGVAV